MRPWTRVERRCAVEVAAGREDRDVESGPRPELRPIGALVGVWPVPALLGSFELLMLLIQTRRSSPGYSPADRTELIPVSKGAMVVCLVSPLR
jgi:hypothetical protein